MQTNFYKGVLGIAFSALLVLLFVFVGTPARASEAIEISDAESFAKFESNPTDSVLTEDITIDNLSTGIGSNISKYSETFDGQNHSITILDFEKTSGNFGLFNYTDGATIKNLIVNIFVTLDITGTVHFGGLIGNSTDTLIQNCIIYLNVTIDNPDNKTLYFGGIFGRDIGGNKVENSAVYLTLNGEVKAESICTGRVSNSDTMAEYCNVLTYDGANALFKTENGDVSITQENATSIVSTLGENWNYCSTCARIVSNFDKIHSCSGVEPEPEPEETISEITPILTKTEYTYNGCVPVLEFAEIVKANEADDIAYSYNIDVVDVGEYEAIITLIGADKDKYCLVNDKITFEIVEAKLTLEIASQSSCYGDDLKQIEYKLNGLNGLECGVTFDLVKNNEKPTKLNAGIYEIVPVLTNDNFVLDSYNQATYTIFEREISLEETNFSKTFDGSSFAPNLTLKNVLESDIDFIGYEYISELPFDADTYNINLKLIGESAVNYILKSNSIEVVINPKNIEVVWSDEILYFNNKIQKPSASISTGIDNYETPILTIDGSGKDVGDYTATCTISDGNFVLNNATKEFKINPYAEKVKWTDLEFTFDNGLHCPQASITLPFVYAFEHKVIGKASGAGTHSAEITTTDKNITFTNPTCEFTIIPATCNIVWGANTLTYNGEKQSPSYSIENPVEGYNITTSISGLGTEVNSYVATVSTEDKNVRLVNAQTTFYIKEYEISLNYSDTSLTFNTNPQIPTITYTKPDFAQSLVITLGGAQTNAGEYYATATCENKNFKIINPTCKFLIEQADVAVVWSDLTFTFDNAEHFPTYSFNSELKYIFEVETFGAEINANTHFARLSTQDKNIKLTNAEISYTILPYEAEVAWGEKSHIFNMNSFAPTANITLPFEYEYSLEITGEQTNVGNYEAIAVCADTNLVLKNSSCAFAITPKDVEITWGTTEFVYTGYIIKPDISFDNGGYAFEVSIQASGLDAGTHVATAICRNPNINLTNATKTYTITPRVCSVMFENTTLVYTGEVISPKPKIVLADNMNPDCAPELYVTQGATSVGVYTATAKTDSANFVLIDNTCVFQIIPNEITAVGGMVGLSVSGEIASTSTLNVDDVTNSVGIELPDNYTLVKAYEISIIEQVNLSLKLASRSSAPVYSYTLEIEEFDEGFELFILSDELTKLDYSITDGKITFTMGANGIVCVAGLVEDKSLIVWLSVGGGIVFVCIIILCFTLICKHVKNRKNM